MKAAIDIFDAMLGEWNNSLATRYGELANASAYINSVMDNINWVGFYLIEENCLKLGPFQGKIACTSVSLDKGVCGKAYRDRKTVVVDNVHTFRDHIACDRDTNSEIVIPLLVNDEVVGVLDLDSINFSRFNSHDRILLEEFSKVIVKKLFL